MKKSKLQKQLFKKYLIGFIVFQILFILVSRFSVAVLSNTFADNLFMADDIYEKIQKEGLEAVTIDQEDHKGAYIEVVDLNYIVTYTDNSPREIGYQYTENEIKKLLNKEPDIPTERAFFLGETLEFLIVNERDNNRLTYLLLVSIFVVFFALLFAYIIFFQVMARMVSSTIKEPIDQLILGINDFKNNIYSSRISFLADNELDNLKDAFNEMAMTVEEQIALREKAEKINKQLILDITHDLKTPLANIEGYSDLLVSNPKLSRSVQEKYLNIITKNSKRTNDLMTDLFELTQIDHSGYQLNKETVNFTEFLRRILSEYVLIFEEESKDYELNIPEKSVYANIDKKMIDRALCNLINNFLAHSGPNTKLTLSLSEKAEEIVLIISDNGKGIEQERVDSIFLPFSRADESRNVNLGGTGLGLAITKKIIEKHKGTISLISDTNQGFELRIILPK